MSKKNSSSMARKERRIVLYKTLFAILFMSPVILAFVFSFVPDDKLYSLPTIRVIIDNFTGENYVKVFKQLPILDYNKTSLIMCAMVIIAQIVTGSLAAYAFAYFKFKGREFFFQMILIAMMIPGQVVTITNFLTVRQLGLLNTYLGLTITGFVGGKSMFMFRQSYLSLPKEMKEATEVDGCGDLRYLFQFAIPLSLPSVASVAIMLFIGEYNAYLWPLLVSRNPKMYTVQIGMTQVIGGDAIPTYGRMMACAISCLVIPIIMYIIGQDYLIKGMTKGAVKG